MFSSSSIKNYLLLIIVLGVLVKFIACYYLICIPVDCLCGLSLICSNSLGTLSVVYTLFLMIESLVVHKFPDSIHPWETTRARGCLALEAMSSLGQRMEIGLDTHLAKLFPAFHRIHRRVSIRIAVNEKHRACRQIEGEFGNDTGVVWVTTFRVGTIGPVCQSIGWVDRHSPLHFTGKFM